MRTSSNPAFRNLPGGQGGGYATFDRQGGMMGGGAAYADARASQVGYGRAGAGERPLTVDDVVTKTAITAGVALVAGILTAVSGAYALALPAFIVGFVVSLIVIFKQSSNRFLVLTYSAAMGVALGGIAGLINNAYPGIAFQALVGTAGVFVGMLVVYKTGAVRVTPKFTKWLMGAMVGVVVLMLANLVGNLFGFDLGLRGGNPTLSIIFSLVVIGVAAFSLLLDFDMADQAIRAGAPAKFAWYIAFGLMTTLVWLYIEILRLLSYLRQD
ncbi:Bax inhibitor-1/YccA family membrane protein [Pseudonocardia acidicola]|uniref:Bax inhibitor-1/YccA family protein n=1 Tax=Pseudonocardia acidicola TaxID=2724939 RepID=A0ABX1SAK1_9PSEU|nr:Bax inhibitor-1/YccA family protein [Pseudonocardia acidicola]